MNIYSSITTRLRAQQEKKSFLTQVIPLSRGFAGGSVVKNLPAKAGASGDGGLIPGWGRSPGRGYDNPLQYSYLENSLDRGAWKAIVHCVAKSWTQMKWLSTQAACPSLRVSRNVCCDCIAVHHLSTSLNSTFTGVSPESIPQETSAYKSQSLRAYFLGNTTSDTIKIKFTYREGEKRMGFGGRS